MNKNLLKIIIACLIIGTFGILFFLMNKVTGESDVADIAKAIYQYKTEKSECLKNLDYQETIEDYKSRTQGLKGLEKCAFNDEKIVELKTKLEQKLTFDYENVDLEIMKKISNDEETTAVEKLNFLLSE